MNVIGISGSLRKGSFDTAALRAAQGLAPEGMTIEVAQIGDLPLYNDDVRAAGFPPPAERLRAQLAAADAILLVSAGVQLFDLRRAQERHRLGRRGPRTSRSRRSPSPSWGRAPASSARRGRSTICARC